MFYIINNTTNTLALFSDEKQCLMRTLNFKPELIGERVLETDIITEAELQQYPYKVLVGDIDVIDENGVTITIKGLILNPNFENENKQRNRTRLDALKLTPADVERALYYSELHMDFDDLKALIAERAPQIDLKGLAIEFRANNFYRGAVDKNGNRIIDMVGAVLGYTPEDMDYLFEHKELPNKTAN